MTSAAADFSMAISIFQRHWCLITQAFKVVLVQTNIWKPKTCLGKSVAQVFLFSRVCTTGNISGYMMRSLNPRTSVKLGSCSVRLSWHFSRVMLRKNSFIPKRLWSLGFPIEIKCGFNLAATLWDVGRRHTLHMQVYGEQGWLGTVYSRHCYMHLQHNKRYPCQAPKSDARCL